MEVSAWFLSPATTLVEGLVLRPLRSPPSLPLLPSPLFFSLTPSFFFLFLPPFSSLLLHPRLLCLLRSEKCPLSKRMGLRLRGPWLLRLEASRPAYIHCLVLFQLKGPQIHTLSPSSSAHFCWWSLVPKLLISDLFPYLFRVTIASCTFLDFWNSKITLQKK